MTPPSAANRKFPRYKCQQRLFVRYRANGHDAIVCGRCTVVGKGGIGAELKAELEIGQVVLLEISMPTAPAPRRLKAQIRNREGFNYGFQFLESDPMTISFLGQLFHPDSVLVPAAAQAV